MLSAIKSAPGILRNPTPRAHDRLRGFMIGCLRPFVLWAERARQRRALAELSNFMLKDIGITQEQARCEYEMPFWR